VSQSAVPTGFHLQRKCACGSYGNGGECDKCRKESSGLQRSACDAAAPAAVPAIVQEVLSSPGQPLERGTRAWMEPKFGHDFSQVRVHTDQKAAESTEAVNAIAYTVGPDVVFGAGRYEPRTEVGSHLLAHELTHVVQQSNSNSLAAQNSKPVSDPSDAAELEAESGARRVMSGDAVSISQAPTATLHALSGWGWAGIGGAALIGAGIAWLAGAFDPEHYSDTDLTEYLTFLATNRHTQGETKSDNKARDVVRHWTSGSAAFNLDNGFHSARGSLTSIEVKRLLIQEMLRGVTTGSDEEAIITILRRSADRQQIVNAIGREKIWHDFSGKNRRIVEAITLTPNEFSDQALVDRLKALPADDLADYRDNAIDPVVKGKIEAIRNLQKITTPLDINTPFDAGGVAHPVVPGFDVDVLPDTTTNDESYKEQADTTIAIDPNPVFPHTHDVSDAGLVTRMDPPGKLRVTIRTIYGPGASRSEQSLYGRGTTPEDISAGRTTVGFHEGNHGLDYLEFLRNNPPPQFGGQVGQSADDYKRADQRFQQEVQAYVDRVIRFSQQRTECVGKPIPPDLAQQHFHDAQICAHVGGGH
jgi:hypothetical protein